MSENPIDPRREKLIALLYGELSAEEEREIRLQIDKDPELRADWEELSATRQILQEWEVEEQAPGFVFVDDSEDAAAAVSTGVLGGWRRRLKGFMTATPWAVAAAAVLVAALAIGDFRIEKSDGGLRVGFGERQTAQMAQGDPTDVDRSLATPIEGGPSTARNVSYGDLMHMPGVSPYVTREEFESYAAGMTQTMIALLNEYDRQREQEIMTYLQATFGGFTQMHDEGYRDLRSRIEALKEGLNNEQYRSDARFDYLMNRDQSGLVAPVSDRGTPADGSEGADK